MKKVGRGKREPMLVSERHRAVVYAVAAALDWRPEEVVSAGVQLFTTFVLNEWAEGLPILRHQKGGKVEWPVEEVLRILGSRFGSRARGDGSLKGRPAKWA